VFFSLSLIKLVNFKQIPYNQSNFVNKICLMKKI